MTKIDHYACAEQHLEAGAEGFEFFDDKAAAANQYALLAIGHALIRITDALERMSDDLDELKRRDKFS